MLLICFPRWEKFPGLFPLLSVYPPSSQRRGLLWFGSPLHHDNKIASRNMFWYVQHAFTCTSSTNSSEHIAGEVQAMKAAAILVWAQGTNGLWLKNLPSWSTVHCYVGPDLPRVLFNILFPLNLQENTHAQHLKSAKNSNADAQGQLS